MPRTATRTNRVLIACGFAIGLLAWGEANSRDWLIYNHSPSIPVGFYWRTQDPIQRGAVVTVRADDVAPAYAALRHFTNQHDRFIKRVAATDGDSVCAEGGVIALNGAELAERMTVDSRGRALPSWSGCRTLSAGEVFLLGDTADSFDGRYFGVVTRSRIEGVWRPLSF